MCSGPGGWTGQTLDSPSKDGLKYKPKVIMQLFGQLSKFKKLS